jgi:hypothetical protein
MAGQHHNFLGLTRFDCWEVGQVEEAGRGRRRGIGGHTPPLVVLTREPVRTLISLALVGIQPVNPLKKTFNKAVAKMEFWILLSNWTLSINVNPCGYPCDSRVADENGSLNGKERRTPSEKSSKFQHPSSKYLD